MELQEEVSKWNELGMSLEKTRHSASSIYSLKFQVQTLINVLIDKGFFTNEDFNLEFKQLLLDDMKRMREQYEPQAQEERRRRIVDGQPDIVVPKAIKLLGPDGKDIRI